MFAEAYAKKTGSGKTGQEAIADLEGAMKKGLVRTAEVLPLVVEEMMRRAAPGMEAASKTSTAEKARAMSMRDRMFESFTKSGGEKGLATMWQALERVFTRLQDRMPQIGALFEKAMNIFAKAVEGFMDISDALFFGKESELTRSLKEFGISLTGIGNFVSSMTGIIVGIAEKLGVGGSLAAILTTWGGAKLATKYLGKKGSEILEKKTGGLLGTSDNISAYAMPGLSALRVFVVNTDYGASDYVDVDGKRKSAPFPPNSGPPKPTAMDKLKKIGKVGMDGGATLLFNPATAAATAVGVGAYLHPNQSSLGVTADPGFMSGSHMGDFDIAGSADKYVKNNIAQATPVVEQAKHATFNMGIAQTIKLDAKIDIKAGTSDEALSMFKSQLQTEVFQPFMLTSLKEAQSTFSNYAK